VQFVAHCQPQRRFSGSVGRFANIHKLAVHCHLAARPFVIMLTRPVQCATLEYLKGLLAIVKIVWISQQNLLLDEISKVYLEHPPRVTISNVSRQ